MSFIFHKILIYNIYHVNTEIATKGKCAQQLSYYV